MGRLEAVRAGIVNLNRVLEEMHLEHERLDACIRSLESLLLTQPKKYGRPALDRADAAPGSEGLGRAATMSSQIQRSEAHGRRGASAGRHCSRP